MTEGQESLSTTGNCPVSGEVNISEISDRLFVMASSMKGVEE